MLSGCNSRSSEEAQYTARTNSSSSSSVALGAPRASVKGTKEFEDIEPSASWTKSAKQFSYPNNNLLPAKDVKYSSSAFLKRTELGNAVSLANEPKVKLKLLKDETQVSTKNDVRAQSSDITGNYVHGKVFDMDCSKIRSPRTGLVPTRCSQTQSSKIGLMSALWGGSVRHMHISQDLGSFVSDPLETDNYLSQKPHKSPRSGSWGESRRSSIGFRRTSYGSRNCGFVGGQFNGCKLSSMSNISKQPTSSSLHSNQISSVKPASHHEPCPYTYVLYRHKSVLEFLCGKK